MGVCTTLTTGDAANAIYNILLYRACIRSSTQITSLLSQGYCDFFFSPKSSEILCSLTVPQFLYSRMGDKFEFELLNATKIL